MTNEDRKLRIRFTQLVRSFPSLDRHLASERIDWLTLMASLKKSWVTPTSRYALLFCLDVWGVDRGDLPKEDREWSFVVAWMRWDVDHKAAALAWINNPFVP